MLGMNSLQLLTGVWLIPADRAPTKFYKSPTGSQCPIQIIRGRLPSPIKLHISVLNSCRRVLLACSAGAKSGSSTSAQHWLVSSSPSSPRASTKMSPMGA
jgi:hypothetical protein